MSTAVEGVPARASLGVIDLVLRDRGVLISRIRRGDVAPILRTMIATIAVTTAIIGAALGSYRGGIQIAYAAVKLPIVLLGTAALSAPVLTAISAAMGRRARLASDLALVVSALAFGALLACACTPLLMLARAMALSYHTMILMTVAVFAIAGIASLQMIVRALAHERARGWGVAVSGLCVVFVLVGGQLSWALRPYLVRPRSEEVPFVREREDSLLEAIHGAVDSARGVYWRDEAPVPESR